MPSLPQYLRSRAKLAVFAGLLGIALGLCGGQVKEPGTSGLLVALGEASRTEVSEFAWEPARSVVSEFLWGRPVLFIGRGAGDQHAELLRAFVRLSPEGRVLGVHRVRDLSQTDLARESGLRAHGRHAVFVSE